MAKLGTYRIQLRAEFPFQSATSITSYWRALGVSHVYCSPYLQATHGSAHGYDVVDHSSINQELGGINARAKFCAELKSHGLEQMLDIVPNHMAIRGGHNKWWWDVLENGQSSRYSNYFDVEWRASEFERVLLPILADQYGVELEAGKITLERQGSHIRVRYQEHTNPLTPRSLGGFLRPVAARLKHAELAFVADALAELAAPNAADRAGRRRRHRDQQVLQAQLQSYLSQPDIAQAVDLHIARTNSSPDALHELLEQQHYRLAHWRSGNQDLDYRRFFDVDSLAGLHVEDEEVYAATHQLVSDWLEDDSVTGLRIDHIDGLYDPLGYLERVRARSASAWLLVEKILEDDEQLPAWPVSGTTGYEFLNQAQRLLVAPEGEATLNALCAEFVGQAQDYATIVRECKALVLREALGSDVKRLVNRLVDICRQHRRFRDYSRLDLDTLVRELCIALPVYRTYVHPDRATSSQDLSTIRHTCKQLRETQPHIDVRLIDFLERLLLLEFRSDAEVEFVLRVQQLTGPVMAKGVEDTVFYRFVRLVALNEVGGNPDQFAITAEQFHEFMARRQACYPEALNATSTHDTKRSEDVRARLLTLSEVPDRWASVVSNWRGRVRANLAKDQRATHQVDGATEYALWQHLVGAWPIDQARMSAFLIKAAREAKTHTSWHAPNQAYEGALQAYMQAVYDDTELCGEVANFVSELEPGFIANALNQTVLKLMCPGVPDIYQGTELWDFSLVDPDNRRPVDYELRQRLLASLDATSVTELWNNRSDGRIKLLLLHAGLRLRADYAPCFGAQGAYQPLRPIGPYASRLISFRRGEDVIAIVSRFWLQHQARFDDTTLTLPEGQWRNAFIHSASVQSNPTDVATKWSGNVLVGDILGTLPCAVLVKSSS